jgi:predicted P-loop ATPase
VRLTEDDYKALEKCYISRDLAVAADLYRVVSIEGRELVGRKGGGDYSGIVFPCRWPGTSGVVLSRLRLDHPPINLSTGKPEYKYLVAQGTRQRFYWPLENPDLIEDPKVAVVIIEGEKKYLAVHRVAYEAGNGQPAFLALGLFGVNAWRGTTGIRATANGERVPQTGPLPDFDRVVWQGRTVYLLFDTNVITNRMVAAARRDLARELERRGAKVYFINVPASDGVNGIDDYLGKTGFAGWGELFRLALRYDWRDELARHEKTGKILGTLGNARKALSAAPVWQGVLRWNTFAKTVEALRTPPWRENTPEAWSDYHILHTEEWLEEQGIRVTKQVAGDAAYMVAKHHPYHPVRDYLESLAWDGTGRLDGWLNLYLGAEVNDYTQAVGARWMISAVARIYQPGCQADHMLILEGLQGIGKSTAFRILGGDYYAGDLADIRDKDAKLAIIGKWIIEVSELSAMSRAEVEHIKNFFSSPSDRVRLPYDRLPQDLPRQAVFGGSCNASHYLQDATGGRRFWPVGCTRLLKADLERDRDQLWAEAVRRYKQLEAWWLESPELSQEASDQQEERYAADAWEITVGEYLDTQRQLITNREISVTEILLKVIEKPIGQWSRQDSDRVIKILRRLGWVEAGRKGPRRDRRRVWRYQPESTQENPRKPKETQTENNGHKD